ncbi:ABC transporter ATP-binding protein [Metamycoplasma hominis]|uniref:AAA family ATPase n=1 Tax=Metamycoplasma hominis TaxID=2098 RepID=UPI0005CA2081|nr:AAA family ATPase [Metamycoplasma hominis]AYK04853.1 ABC transporter ATP-binding protein [Metamycoplasma hominis]MCF1355007.1 AAA family ATPase [Metamycoplasma hominis]QKX36863.1 AAA family ATPase [Metamycoplasma hominis]QKX39655.1 AAA family ATPase [Metamycoplasma hominis]QKX40193.1 AAA family ATPase [Metamycoplasma hominis]
MKLIQVEAHGFKSFADKVTLKFDGGIVAIIGPNGSGKSNINDAIRWVLGETSSKVLRGDTMEDVIFSGSKTEKEMDRAEVILTFDNKDRSCDIPYDVFTISRVLTRGNGSNEYYINGELARQRDIKEIAMQSGISKSSLAIIGQGTISNIAESTPEKRREIFEDAAGTSMYKSKKIEAQRKLEKTQEALEQISILIQEQERQLKPLQRQAEKAKIYKTKAEQLKEVEVALLVHDFMDYSDKLEKLNVEGQDYNLIKEELETKIRVYNEASEQKSKFVLELENNIKKISERLSEISEEITTLEIRNAKEAKHREMLLSGELTISPKEKLAAMKEELNALNTNILGYKTFLETKKKESEQLSQSASIRSTKINDIKRELSFKKEELNKIKSKLDVIEEIKSKKTNLAKGTHNIVENSHLFRGYKALVSELIEVNEKYALAIETILSSAMQHIVVDKPETAVEAINFLKSNNGGRATFIPLSSIKPKFVPEQHIVVAQTQKGFLGIASELVSTEEQYNVLKKFLLGNVLVADNIENANKLSKLLETRYMVVTLDGDIIRVGGVLSGGQASQNVSTLAADEQVKKLQDLIPVINAKISQLSNELFELEKDQNKETSLLTNISLERAKIDNLYRTTLDKFDSLREQYRSASQEEYEAENNKKIDIVAAIQQLMLERSDLSAKKSSQEDIYHNLKQELQNLTNQRFQVSEELNNLIKDNANKIAEKAKAETIIQNAKQRLSEQYGMLFEVAKQFYNPDIDFEVARKTVADLKLDIRELGHVNLDSINQLEELETRYKEVKSQEQEIISAKTTIEDAISEMDKIIIERMTQTVTLVNAEFKHVFAKMFGGGMAEIRYTDPENILETGIDVIAQPPGKSIKNLKLFSGGEKALIAISLLFSILKAKPLPLCILDEVEAALDEANVIRFAEYLHTLKKDTQFIVITHRQGTMERVNKLYGATMQKRGVTTFFAVNLSDAKKTIENNN